MTKPDHEYEAPDDARAAIAAFLDGEDVDARALKDALSDAEGRDYFVDLLVLRRSVQATFEPRGAVTAVPRTSRLRALAVAAAVVIALGSGYAAGRFAVAETREPEMSPVVVEFGQFAPPPAPEPTRVIELTPGRNWKDEGGN
jgi:hypothetical protein